MSIFTQPQSRRITRVLLIATLGATLCILLALWIAYFGKTVVFNSVSLIKVENRDGVLSIWYFHPPFRWGDDKFGIDVDETSTELQVRFVVTQWQWPFTGVNHEGIFDDSQDAFRVDAPTLQEKRVIAVSKNGKRVQIWPLVEPLPPGGVDLNALGS